MSQSLLLATTLLLLATLFVYSEGNQAPVVHFMISPIEPDAGVLPRLDRENAFFVGFSVEKETAEIQLDASTSVDPDGDNVRYLWDFGDGTTSENTVVRHVFPYLPHPLTPWSDYFLRKVCPSIK